MWEQLMIPFEEYEVKTLTINFPEEEVKQELKSVLSTNSNKCQKSTERQLDLPKEQ